MLLAAMKREILSTKKTRNLHKKASFQGFFSSSLSYYNIERMDGQGRTVWMDGKVTDRLYARSILPVQPLMSFVSFFLPVLIILLAGTQDKATQRVHLALRKDHQKGDDNCKEEDSTERRQKLRWFVTSHVPVM